MPKKIKKIPEKFHISFLLTAIIIIIIASFAVIFLGNLGKSSVNTGKKLILDPLIARYSPPGVEPLVVKRSGFKIVGNITSGSYSIHVPILLYHYVEINKDLADTIRHGLTISPYWFEQQAKYLVENNYTTITIEDLTSALERKQDLPSKPVILTFDDGYRDFYTDAYPILKKYNLKATNFVFPNVLNKKNNMDNWMVKEISNSGLVTIGSHTLSHAYLSKLQQNLAQKEIFESKIILEQIIGKPVNVFAYPYGAFDKEAVELVQKAGYIAAVSTIKGNNQSVNSLFNLSRIRVGNFAGEQFKKLLDE